MFTNFKKWLYGGQEKAVFKAESELIGIYNTKVLWKVNLLLTILFGLLTIASMLIPSYRANFDIFLLFMLMFAVLSAESFYHAHNNGKVSNVWIYTTLLITFMFILSNYMVLGNDRSVTILAIFYVILPVIFMLPIHHIGLFEIISLVVFEITTTYAKGFDTVIGGSIICAVSLIASLILGQEILKNKLSNIIELAKSKNDSNCDGLTGIPNRRRVNEYAAKAFSNPLGFAVAMFDVDNFKLYNDTYGHTRGDDALIKVAQALNDVASKYGVFVGRYGGEEFLLIVEGQAASAISIIVDDCMRAVRSLHIQHKHNSNHGYVTLSAGYADRSQVKDAEDVTDVIKAADTAQYQAKENGRNTVVAFSSTQ